MLVGWAKIKIWIWMNDFLICTIDQSQLSLTHTYVHINTSHTRQVGVQPWHTSYCTEQYKYMHDKQKHFKSNPAE